MRTILHIDMDAFFASVEQRQNPSLRGRPVIVGGPSLRGVVCAASYEARPFGVRAAMPMVEALRRCPDAVVVGPRHDVYGAVSKRIFEIFQRYTPLVEGLSMDEAFLDVTGSRRLHGDGPEIAAAIKGAIIEELGLVASAGVAPNKFVAKIASDFEKPNGLVVIDSAKVRTFLSPLPIQRMWGVGPVVSQKLLGVGIATIGDLARACPTRLENLLGSWGRQVHHLARGEDERPVEPRAPQKSIGGEVTFERDTSSRAFIENQLLSQVVRVASRLNKRGVVGHVVTVKVKDARFKSRSSRRKLSSPVYDTDSIREVALELLQGLLRGGSLLRLVGLSVSELSTGEVQPSLFIDEVKRKRETVQDVSDAITARFGQGGLVRGSLLEVEE